MNKIKEYKKLSINKLMIQGTNFKDNVLTSEPLIIHKTLYNTTMELSIILNAGEGHLINPGSLVEADIDYGSSNHTFTTMVESFDIETKFISIDEPVIIYNIKTMPLDSVLARRTIYGDVYNIIDLNGNKTTMPLLQKQMRKLSDIDVLLDRNDKDNIKNIQGWNTLINSDNLEKMVRADVEDEYYIKLKQEVKHKFQLYKDSYINIKYSKPSETLMAGDIVNHYVAKYLPEEGISPGRIDPGVDIWETDIEEFDTVSLKHILDELANASGYVWFIDDNRRLNFYKDIEPKGELKEVIKKDNLNDFIILNASKTIQNYYNKVFIRGGEPYEDVEEDMLDLSGNIKYTKELPVEIMKQKEITGMSGVHGTVHMNNRIHTIKDAADLAENLLGRAGRLPHKLEISTNKTHLNILDKVYIDLPDINMVGMGVITSLDIKWLIRDEKEDKAETIITIEPISSLSNLKEDWASFMNKLVMNVNNLGKKMTQIVDGSPSGGNSLNYIGGTSPILPEIEDPEIPVDPDPDPGEIPPAPGRINDFHMDFTKKGTVVGENQIINSFNKQQLAGSLRFKNWEIGTASNTKFSFLVGTKESSVVEIDLAEYYRNIPFGTIFIVADIGTKKVDGEWVKGNKGGLRIDMPKNILRDTSDFPFLNQSDSIYSFMYRIGSRYGSSGFSFYYSRLYEEVFQSIYDYANLYHNGDYIPSIPKLERQFGFQIIGFNSGKGIDEDTTIITSPQEWHKMSRIILKNDSGFDVRLYEIVAYNRVLSEREYKQTYNYLCKKYEKENWII